ncbi:MAG: FadR/GntR family transcriptional regulator [Fuerstiella sp.]
MDLAQVQVRSRSLVTQVSAQLAELIRAQPADGDRQLPAERRLAEQIGVSRQVVREAIRQLEHQGLLEVRQGSGIRIVDQLQRPVTGSLSLLIPDVEERLHQLLEARLAIEPEAARLAAIRATKDQVLQLQQIHGQMEVAQADPTAIQCDLDFHRALAGASGNLMFRLILDSLAEISLESRQRTIGRVGRQTAIQQHGCILDAILARDPTAAAESMRQHLYTAGRDMRCESPS